MSSFKDFSGLAQLSVLFHNSLVGLRTRTLPLLVNQETDESDQQDEKDDNTDDNTDEGSRGEAGRGGSLKIKRIKENFSDIIFSQFTRKEM